MAGTNLNTAGPQPFTADPGQSVQAGGEQAQVVDNGLVGFGRQIQGAAEHVGQQMEENETRDTLVQSHELRAKYMKELNDAKINGADITEINDRFQADQQAITDNVTYKSSEKAARVSNSESSMMFAAHASNINAERAGAAAKQQMTRALAAQGDILRMDPGQLPYAIQSYNDLAETYKGRLSPEHIEAMKLEGAQHLTVASVESMVRQNPEMAKTMLENPKDFTMWNNLSPEMREAGLRDAQGMINARYADAEHARMAELRAKQEANDKAFDGMLVDLSKGDNGSWTEEKIFGMTDISPEMKTHMAGVLKVYRKDGDKDPANFNAAYKGIIEGKYHLADIDAMLLQRSPTGVELDPKQHAYLKQMFERQERPSGKMENELIHRIQNTVNPKDAIGRILTPNGEANAYAAAFEINRIVDEWTKAGGKPEEILDPSGKVFKENIQPVIDRLKPRSLIQYKDNGTVGGMGAAPGTTENPYTIKKGQEDTIKPGDAYHYEGETGIRKRAGKAAPSLTAPVTTPAPTTPAPAGGPVKPNPLPNGFVPTPEMQNMMHAAPVEQSMGNPAGQTTTGATLLPSGKVEMEAGSVTQLKRPKNGAPQVKAPRESWMPQAADERDSYVEQYGEDAKAAQEQMKKAARIAEDNKPVRGDHRIWDNAIRRPDAGLHAKATKEYYDAHARMKEAERRIKIMKDMKF